jgi:hypothetical protein
MAMATCATEFGTTSSEFWVAGLPYNNYILSGEHTMCMSTIGSCTATNLLTEISLTYG